MSSSDIASIVSQINPDLLSGYPTDYLRNLAKRLGYNPPSAVCKNKSKLVTYVRSCVEKKKRGLSDSSNPSSPRSPDSSLPCTPTSSPPPSCPTSPSPSSFLSPSSLPSNINYSDHQPPIFQPSLYNLQPSSNTSSPNIPICNPQPSNPQPSSNVQSNNQQSNMSLFNNQASSNIQSNNQQSNMSLFNNQASSNVQSNNQQSNMSLFNNQQPTISLSNNQQSNNQESNTPIIILSSNEVQSVSMDKSQKPKVDDVKYQIEVQFEDKEFDISIIKNKEVEKIKVEDENGKAVLIPINTQKISPVSPISPTDIIRDQLKGYIHTGYIQRIESIIGRLLKDSNKEEIERTINTLCGEIAEDIRNSIYDIGKIEKWIIYGGKYGLLPIEFMNNDEDVMMYVYCKVNKLDQYMERKWNMIEGKIDGKDNLGIRNNMITKVANVNLLRDMVKNYEIYKKRKEYPVCGYDLLSLEVNDLYYLLVRDGVNYKLSMLDPLRTYNIEYYRRKVLQSIGKIMEDMKVDDRDGKMLLLGIMKPHELWYVVCTGNIVIPKEFNRYKELEELKIDAKNALYKIYGRDNISEILSLEEYNKIEDAIYLSDCGGHNIGEIAKSIGMMVPNGVSIYKYFMDNVHYYTHLFDSNSPRIALIQDIREGRKVVGKDNGTDTTRYISCNDLLYLTDHEICIIFGIGEKDVIFNNRLTLISEVVSKYL